ncbi:YnhF family membrane protein [Edwardsiella ictaluri]|uniref:YnhF family membrane protein n=1 Tax=Edwardsiella ictaluri TaxID=67780 RepID=A0ABY8GFU9_EDWIC|nr:YnhF family membrane protein [Edwardsiella ictaluri]AVZ83663.1 YnhF family membrane protein [Edwardsiella ictaluri]EKS7763918.1 YnhF family membrane protein [Edwardsiella ictaluri]EKS7770700.1 YnhF family membrane protein [Edwardsiella ictaluri]EKS7773842.1 YnhF family membrane protein [Edwardsiella ictaluri]EKS7777210.1 YnhF family membrane protein [Edwardsiella ictaluri]
MENDLKYSLVTTVVALALIVVASLIAVLH